jgi:hypothetical protein
MNCRWLGVFKIDRAADAPALWHWGENGDFTFSPTSSQFSDLHDPELHTDGTILVYDNGGFGTGDFHSRVLEYQLDQQGLIATLNWEFPGNFAVDAWYTDDWYTPYWGDADRLASGNILVTAGIRSMTQPTRIFEIRPEDGTVVWEIVQPPNTGSYRAERLSPPPLVERL